jgi:DNA topoisomerase-3
VQTPTLAIVVEREEKIRKHVRRAHYWEVRATFDAEAGEYEGRWFDPASRRNDDADAARRAAVGRRRGRGDREAEVPGKPGTSPRRPSRARRARRCCTT